MKVIESAVRYPVTTAVGVIFLVLFGSLALFRIPVQLTPTVEEPEITVTTIWPGASPQEVEREIVDEQEEQLQSLEGLLRLESSSADSSGTVILTFPVGTDIDAAVLKVSNRLEQVPQYPEDADKPVITTVSPGEGAVGWWTLRPAGENPFEGDISTLNNFVEDSIKAEFERVPGVGASSFFGGREHELQVVVDPARLASRGVTWGELAAALDRENRNFSGGDFDEGKRRYVVRTIGEYLSPEDVQDIVIAVRDGVPIYLRDVGEARLGYRKARTRVFSKGERVIGINAVREAGSNVLEVMDGLRATVARLNAEVLAPRGLELVQSYDETEYVEGAIDLVSQSLVIGGILAVLVLLVFLRSASSTLVVAAAIPISIVGTFMMMAVFGRTLNVVSLAGLAFAVGMVVDNSIVVLENIYRHRQMGKSLFDSAQDGAAEVWGAVLASTLTTVAVFVPVIFMQEEAGQLFGDIAVAISCAVVLSLIVSMTVIPSLSARILRTAAEGEESEADGKSLRSLWGFTAVAARANRAMQDLVYQITGSTRQRLAVVLGLTLTAIGLSGLLMPKTEYLPIGNNNWLFGVMLPPPGYSLDEVSELRAPYDDAMRPLWESEPGSKEAKAQPGGGVNGFFYLMFSERAFMGVRAREPLRVRELLPEFAKLSGRIPGSFVVMSQASIFARGLDEGRNIDIDVTGPDLPQLLRLGGEIFGRAMQLMPGAQGRPIPGLDLDNPEVQVITDRRRASELGLSNRELGFAVSALVDGAKASDYIHEGREIDLRVMAQESAPHRTHLLEQLPIATPGGELVTLGSVANIVERNGPVQINHRERVRAVTLRITPEEERPLEEAIELVQGQILDPLREEGRLGGLYQAHLSGTADKLSQTADTLKWNFVLALVITYLLLAALFESFLYPFVIMFSVPLAALGGFLGLSFTNLFVYQPLDVLTMLGFIILVGTVVNNAILVVHQSLNHMRVDGLAPREAIRAAVGNRIRPIFMSVATSVCGMLPLVLFPGAGSELYRGLGSVVVGGLIVSTVFTLLLVPALFSLVLDARQALGRRASVALG